MTTAFALLNVSGMAQRKKLSYFGVLIDSHSQLVQLDKDLPNWHSADLYHNGKGLSQENNSAKQQAFGSTSFAGIGSIRQFDQPQGSAPAKVSRPV